MKSKTVMLNEAQEARMEIREARFEGQTSGMAPGIVQGNLVILPQKQASDFLQFCKLNPKPCPLIGKSEPGNPFLPELGENIDIRTDVPRYFVYRNGEQTEELSDVRALWNEELVTFVLGCSFSFEEALIQEGLCPRNVEKKTNVSMYRTNIETTPAGIFKGPLVVTMRPYIPQDAIRAILITARFPRTHGAPVYFGDSTGIGIQNLEYPDYGERVDIYEGEIPVFWACGVTPQAAIEQAKVPFCITHKPGSMLITDLLNSDLMV